MNLLMEKEFSYQITKSNKVFIFYAGKQVKVLKGKDADKFIQRLSWLENDDEVQLMLAKLTGNFKRGNEKVAKLKN
jgi:hypothetical protein